jgi:hypothetical protein
MKLYIIGNGFDLDLGIKSGYNDFLKSDQFKNLVNPNTECDFAKYLFKQINNESEVKWVDIEIELKRYVNNICSKSPTAFKEEFNSLTKALQSYLLSVNVLNPIDESKGSIRLVKKIINDLKGTQSTTRIINFNYTSNIVQLVDNLNRKNYSTTLIDLINVHGKLNEEIILGIEDGALIDQKEDFVFLKKGMNDSYSNNKWHQSYLEAKEITIFGHSLGESDQDVFKPMFENLLQTRSMSKVINIYFHPKDVGYISKRINRLLDGAITTFKTVHDLRLNPKWN